MWEWGNSTDRYKDLQKHLRAAGNKLREIIKGEKKIQMFYTF